MELLRGHFQKAKALCAAYHFGKVRKRKANPFLGSTSSLPRLLAMHGTRGPPCSPWKVHHLLNLIRLKTRLNGCLHLAVMVLHHTVDHREWTGC